MKRIGIDIRMSRHTGIGRYIRGMVGALENGSRKLEYLLIGSENSRSDFRGLPFRSTAIPIYSFQEQAMLPFAAGACDCLHVPHYNAPVFWNRKLVVTIHDLIHLHFQDYLPSPLAAFYAQTVLPLVVQKTTAIIVVSEYTKKDLVETLRVDPKKVTVIYHGVDPIFALSQNSSGPENHSKPPESHEPYFLYVGLIKAHKNIGVLLEAFQHLKKELVFPGLKLRLIGTPDRKQLVVRRWLEVIGRDPNIILESGIGDDQLRKLYQFATALIFPSLCEGFGFPLIEAMACGTPIICARSSSIPEVVGEKAGLYFDPHSPLELKNCMRRMVAGADLRQQLIHEGFQRLPMFSWEEAARKTEKVYETALRTI